MGVNAEIVGTKLVQIGRAYAYEWRPLVKRVKKEGKGKREILKTLTQL